MLGRVKQSYVGFGTLMVVSFLVSAIGSDKKRSEGGTYWVGAVGWFAFCLTVVATAAFTLVLLVRSRLRRTGA